MRSIPFLVLLAACPDPATDAKSDDGEDIDTGTPACAATVLGTTPEADATDVYYRGDIVVSFTDDAADALIEVRDSAGAAVPATITWGEGNVQAFVDTVLAPSADFTLHVEICGASTDVAFETSALGTPLTLGAADLVDRTYVFRLSESTITEPAFLNALAGSYLTVPLLIGVQAASETEIDYLGSLGELQDNGTFRQLMDGATWDFPPADFTGTPYFEARADFITIMYLDMPIPVEDFTLSGTFTADASFIEQGYVTGFGDSRYMGELVGKPDEPNALCAIAEGAGVECAACSDGEPYCLYIVAEDITAEYEPGLTLTVVE